MIISDNEKNAILQMFADIQSAYRDVLTEISKVNMEGEYEIAVARQGMMTELSDRIIALANMMNISFREIEQKCTVTGVRERQICDYKCKTETPANIPVDENIPCISDEVGDAEPDDTGTVAMFSISNAEMREPSNIRAEAYRRYKKGVTSTKKPKRPRGRPRKVKE